MTDTSMSALVAASVIPPIISLIQVKRTAASPLEDGSHIGDRIPPAIWLTVELQNTREHTHIYGKQHAELAPNVNIGYDEETEEGRVHTKFHRWLCLLTAGLDLPRIVLDTRRSRKGLQVTFAQYADHGATFYFLMTRPASELPTYHDRTAMAWYLSMYSVKLKALIDIAYEVCVKNQRRLLVFCEWPLTQWFVEMALLNMGFPTWAIRATHSASEREGGSQEVKECKREQYGERGKGILD